MKLKDGESQEFKDIDDSMINPATGPIFIEGVELGDLLKVDIISIDIGERE